MNDVTIHRNMGVGTFYILSESFVNSVNNCLNIHSRVSLSAPEKEQHYQPLKLQLITYKTEKSKICNFKM